MKKEVQIDRMTRTPITYHEIITEDIGVRLTWCHNCNKKTMSKMSEDWTHFMCEECRGVK